MSDSAALICPQCGGAGEPDTEWNLCDACYTKLRDEEAAAGYEAMQREQERQWREGEEERQWLEWQAERQRREAERRWREARW